MQLTKEKIAHLGTLALVSAITVAGVWAAVELPRTITADRNQENVTRPQDARSGDQRRSSLPEESGEPVIIALPFDPAIDVPSGLEPMGETINHPKTISPLGHSGLDFGFNRQPRLLASFDGEVMAINRHGGEFGDPDLWEVHLKNGRYRVSYQELEEYAPGLKVGDKVNKGDFIGYPDYTVSTVTSVVRGKQVEEKQEGWIFHWELGYSNDIYGDRICPVTYFEPTHGALLEEWWAKGTYKHQDQFPDLCSGDYSGKDK